MPKQHVQLTPTDRDTLTALITKGDQKARIYKIEFSALARGCLNRRIATQAELRREVLAFFQEREAKGIPLNWQFTLPKARDKMNTHYQRVYPDNSKLKIT